MTDKPHLEIALTNRGSSSYRIEFDRVKDKVSVLIIRVSPNNRRHTLVAQKWVDADVLLGFFRMMETTPPNTEASGGEG